MIPCVVISGPTGIGKTAASIALGNFIQKHHSRTIEIISCDSIQYYKGLDVGSGKASLAQQQQFKHHLIDCQTVSETYQDVEPYSAGRFGRIARTLVKDIWKRGNVPVIVGGSLFYLDLLFHIVPGTSLAPSTVASRTWSSNLMKRDLSLHQSASRLSWANPQILYGMDISSARSIERALILQHFDRNSTSPESVQPAKPYGILFDRSNQDSEILFRGIFLTMQMETLKRITDQRCIGMLLDGLIKEVATFQSFLNVNSVPGSSIGYKESMEFLEKAGTAMAMECGEKALDGLFCDFVRLFQTATRRYATGQANQARKHLSSQLSYVPRDDLFQSDEIYARLAGFACGESGSGWDSDSFFRNYHEKSKSMHKCKDLAASITYESSLGPFEDDSFRSKFITDSVLPYIEYNASRSEIKL